MKRIQDVVEKKNGKRPERVLQFGEGNFLRAFTDWMIDEANDAGDYDGSIVVCQAIPQGMIGMLNDQDCVYTLAMRGIEDGEAVEKFKQITSISRCISAYDDFEELMQIARSEELQVIISNTTEAGIVYREGDRPDDKPPVSYPAKLTVLLYERYKHFGGSKESGVVVLPVELIDDNGGVLARVVKRYATEWELGDGFLKWLDESVEITSTLVDRIVTGYPRDEIGRFTEKLGYEDNALVTSEVFNLWVIEGDSAWADKFPIHKTKANVLWTDNVKPYKMRKVRILNGGHTSTVLAAWLAGHNIVLDFMNDPLFRKYLDTLIFDEIIPTLDLPREELEEFAGSVADRFANPYIKHRLLDISLNSCSKFAARSLPSLLGYIERKGEVPALLAFSLAAFMAFYKGEMVDGKYTGTRPDGTSYAIVDDAEVMEFFCAQWAGNDAKTVAHNALAQASFWDGQDLTKIPGLEAVVAENLENILEKGARATIEGLLG